MRVSRRVAAGVVLLALVLAASAAVSYRAWKRSQNRFKPVIGTNEDALRLTVGSGPTLPPVIERSEMTDFRIDEVARGLRIVWSVRVAPDGRVFLSERAGKLSVLAPGAGHPVLYASLSTALGGESGLMGVALHPRFPAEPFVYVMYTARKRGGGVNRVSRLRDTPEGGVDEQILIDDIPASRNHDGGALEFGPDGMLYVGTGDAAVPALAQDLQQPSGKILRVAPDGSIPVDNPIPGSSVWAYGFRNVSGLAFHPQTGELWAATHGPSGVAEHEPKHMDAIFVVRKGGNHGWPTHLGASDDPAIVSPVIFFRDRAVPPGGMMFYDATGPYQQSLFLTSLRGQALYRFVIAEGRRVERVERWWPDRFGRLRAIGRGPNGTLYIGTSNQDLRASREYPGSDYLLRLTPTVTP